jgi:ribosomal protein S18 acetylase RimI-like enzyme
MTPPERFDPALLARVEDAGLNASAPPQQRWMDGWLVRFSPGKAKRARCVNAVATGRLPLDDKLALAESVFADAGLPLIVRITPMSQPVSLDAELQARGLRRFDDTRVMLLPDLNAGALAQKPLPPDVTLHAVGLEPFAQHVGALRGSPLSQRQAHGQRLANAPVPFHAFELHADGALVCCAQMAIEADLVGLYDVYTAPASRGRGHASRLCRHLLSMARDRGARHAYLQVEGDNHDARAIYHRLGFADGYAYHYRTRDPQAA